MLDISTFEHLLPAKDAVNDPTAKEKGVVDKSTVNIYLLFSSANEKLDIIGVLAISLSYILLSPPILWAAKTPFTVTNMDGPEAS